MGSMADECARVAERAEQLAKLAKSDLERQGFEKIAREWRALENVARGQKPTD